MSVLANVQAALENVGIPIGMGKYPEAQGDCGKLVFTGKEKPKRFLGGVEAGVEAFRIVVRGGDYGALVRHADDVRDALKAVGYVQTGGYEDVESKEGEAALQLAVYFKNI